MPKSDRSVLIETDELEQILETDDLCVIETDIDNNEYRNAHIPGSVFWSVHDLFDQNSAMLTDLSRIQQMLEQSGIAPDTHVVFAHNSHRGTSGWMYWFFRRFGHTSMQVLNGGREKWLAECRHHTSEDAVRPRSEYPLGAISDANTSGVENVLASSRDGAAIILDVRTKAEFDGEVYLQGPPKAGERAGHIPGAIHLHIEDMHRSDGTFKPTEELRELLSSIGVDRNMPVYPYCAVGGARSAHAWFILTELLGFDEVKNFAGSWRVWSTTPGLPVE